MTVEKSRYEPGQRGLYPIATLNSALARPFSAVLAAAGFTPNQVSLLSLLVSIVGLLAVATMQWPVAAWGVAAVYLGLILDHADGQVARRRNMGSTWGMYLDMVIDRIVEVGLIVAIASGDSIAGRPEGWAPVPPTWMPALAAATVGVMFVWRFFTAYNDVLFLRSHLLASNRLPDPQRKPKHLAKRPLLPWVFNRDWVVLIWGAGVLLNQLQGLLLLLLVLHALATLEKILVFFVRHKDPEGDASRILGREYH